MHMLVPGGAYEGMADTPSARCTREEREIVPPRIASLLPPVHVPPSIRAAAAFDLTAANPFHSHQHAASDLTAATHPFRSHQHAASDLTVATPLRGVIAIRSPPRLLTKYGSTSLPISTAVHTHVHTHVHAYVHAYEHAHVPWAWGARDARPPNMPTMDESLYLLRYADEMHLVPPPPDASVRCFTTVAPPSDINERHLPGHRSARLAPPQAMHAHANHLPGHRSARLAPPPHPHCTLYPSPRGRPLVPCTLNPSPRGRHTVPCTLNPSPRGRHPPAVPCTRAQPGRRARTTIPVPCTPALDESDDLASLYSRLPYMADASPGVYAASRPDPDPTPPRLYPLLPGSTPPRLYPPGEASFGRSRHFEMALEPQALRSQARVRAAMRLQGHDPTIGLHDHACDHDGRLPHDMRELLPLVRTTWEASTGGWSEPLGADFEWRCSAGQLLHRSTDRPTGGLTGGAGCRGQQQPSRHVITPSAPALPLAPPTTPLSPPPRTPGQLSHAQPQAPPKRAKASN